MLNFDLFYYYFLLNLYFNYYYLYRYFIINCFFIKTDSNDGFRTWSSHFQNQQRNYFLV
jgi:hypothetical protein